MKQRILLILITLGLTIITGCRKEEVKVDFKDLVISFEEGDTIDNVSHNFNLPQTYQEQEVIWMSSNPELVKVEGGIALIVGEVEQDTLVKVWAIVNGKESPKFYITVTAKKNNNGGGNGSGNGSGGDINNPNGDTSYTVNYVFPNDGLVSPGNQSETLKAVANSRTNYIAKKFDGFEATSFEQITLSKEASKNVITINMVRKSYTVSYTNRTGNLVEKSFLYGEEISIPLESKKDDYEHRGFIETVPSNMPAKNITLVPHYVYVGVSEYSGYYVSINNSMLTNPSALKSELNKIINAGYKGWGYSSTMAPLKEADVYVDENGRVDSKLWLVYWDPGKTSSSVNREHVWPQSKLGSASKSDMHNLRLSDSGINSKRSNYVFAQGTGSEGSLVSGGFFPGDKHKGDIARILMYMTVKWNGLTLGESNGNGKMGKLSVLLKWHNEDPVSEFERHRNGVLYEKQKNRNPFIDHPEFFEPIYNMYKGISAKEIYQKEIYDYSVMAYKELSTNYFEYSNKSYQF